MDWLSIRGPEYPSYSDRTFWNGLPENWKEKYIKAGEKYLDYNWPSVKATSYLRFMQDGDRNSMQSINGQ
ncbi:hypothetical protein [Carboxylicivirga sp. N1E11]|uniref:hypothetical protein n=1 Tax=Carboxylicivirga longa TaxID=3134029 RepID=UPI003D325322